MSETLRIGLVGEGPLDHVLLYAALEACLPGRAFDLRMIQPEGSLAFGELGTGWGGVYRWCHQSAERGGGRLSADRLAFVELDLLILHLDADVAEKKYPDISVEPEAQDGALPCAAPCPPAKASTDPLRQVLSSWCGETGTLPARVVLCTPSKETGSWLLAALRPELGNVECINNASSRLETLPKSQRVHKSTASYRARAGVLRERWADCAKRLDEMARFEHDLLAAVGEEGTI